MSRRGTPRGERVMATLLTNTPLRTLEVSQTGCLVESAYRIEAGTAGRLRLLIDGRTYSGEARVTRCQRVHGGTAYRLGVEFLRTRRPSASSLYHVVDEMLDSRGREPKEERSWLTGERTFVPPEDGASTPQKEKVMKTLLVRLVREEEAQDLIEYALLAAFISLAAIVTLEAIGPLIKTRYDAIKTALTVTP